MCMMMMGADPVLVSVMATSNSVVARTDATFTFSRTGATNDELSVWL